MHGYTLFDEASNPCMGVDMICNVGGLDDYCARSAQKIYTQLLKMP